MSSLLYFLALGALFLFMMRFGCGAHVMGHGHGHAGHGRGGASRSDDDGTPSGANPPEQVKDPVCGMTVNSATAKATVFAGRAYYFCSATCRDKFEAAPAQYAGAAPVHTKEHRHGC